MDMLDNLMGVMTERAERMQKQSDDLMAMDAVALATNPKLLQAVIAQQAQMLALVADSLGHIRPCHRIGARWDGTPARPEL
ncbi:MAG: hypothetical protein K0R85_400 [Devosia sp.]|jgi:hypothetical protein|nr:hypothetical protein [Devosia sp.]